MLPVQAVSAAPHPGTGPSAPVAGWWAPGLTLAERCALPRRVPVPAGPQPRAARRLARWRETHGLADSGQFARRLDALRITEAELAVLLAEERAELAARATRPDWAVFTETAIARVPVPRTVPEPAEPWRDDWSAGLAVIVEPFAELGYERLAAAARDERLDGTVEPAALRACFLDRLVGQLVVLSARTLVLELNVRRVTGGLAGDTPQQRFWSFARQLGQRSALVALVEEYPVLARLHAGTATYAVTSWLELLRRFAADRPRIVAELFGGADPGRLVEVVPGRGDPHRRGRSVAVLRFESGARLVYKPRPLAVHVHANDCVDWLNRILPGTGLRRLAVLDRGAYGWIEFAEHRACADRAGLRRYFRRQGALLALLYALDGADFHFENLIASGDQPVLVDLEALFHPNLPFAGLELVTGDPARAAYESSVFRVGLLPTLVFGDDRAVMDLGGNGGDAGAALPFKSATWAGAGTDRMRLVRAQPPFPGSQNRPRLGDTEPDPGEFEADLLAGFRAGYDAIAVNRHDLLGPAGLLSRFAADEVRVVARPSQLYATLLHESTHPDVMRDALDRDRILDYLWAASADDPLRGRLVEYERADLWAGDLPLIATRPGRRDLWIGDDARLRRVLETTGLDRAIRKVGAMGPADREVQEWVIRASFAARRATVAVSERPPEPPAVAPPSSAASPPAAPPAAEVDPDRVLAAARLIGDRLVGAAHRDRNRVGWLGLHFVDDARYVLRPLDSELYDGFPGVALFLSQLAAVTGEQRYAEVAHRALAPVRRYAEALRDRTGDGPRCGAFHGLTGLAYALVHAAVNLSAPELLAPVEPLVAAVAPGVAGDEVLDVIGGSAGGLVAMLAIHETTGSLWALEVARACGNRLMDTARAQEQGVAWGVAPGSGRPLAGFSHGAAGMGWALLRLAACTGQSRYARVGLEAFRYERSLYSEERGGWPDLREPSGTGAISAWCHGAPGIGLSRVDSRHTHLPEVAADLELAVRGLLATEPVANLSLCHGQLGNLDLLTEARPDSAERAALARRALATFERAGPACGTPGGVETAGLMAGLAGIGHGLLRLGFPHRVPSVLLLQPPVVSPC